MAIPAGEDVQWACLVDPNTGAGYNAVTPITGTGGVTAVTVGTASAQAIAAATRTAILAFKNESTSASIAISLGGTAALNTAGSFTIPPGQLLTLSTPAYVPGDAINAIASAATTPMTVFAK